MEYITKSNYIYEHLKNEVINGKLRAGERIVIADVAKRYSVSPMPIREAMNRLHQDGYIEYQPHKGIRVASFDLERFNEIGLIRIELESLAAKLAVPYIDASIIAKLEDSIKEQELCVQKGDNLKFTQLNRDFHLIIYNASKCTYLCDLILSLWSKSEFSKTIFIRFAFKARESLDEHIQWLDAIKEKDEVKCHQIVQLHKRKSFEMLNKEFAKEQEQQVNI